MPGYLKLKPKFTQRLITEYLTSSRVVTEKPCYLFASLVTPHAFSIDCNVRLRNGEVITSDILLNLKTQYEQCMHSYSPPIYFNRGLYVELVGEILLLLDDCGDTSNIEDWVETYDGLNPIDNQVYVKEGSHSMALGIDADLNAAEYGRWTNSQSQGDLSDYEHDWLYLMIYFPTLDYLKAAGTTFSMFIGTDGANRMWWDFTKASLSVGWNLLKCDLDSPVFEAGVVDWTDISYLHIRLYEVAGNTNDFTIYVDSIMFVRPFPGATDGITKGATVQYLIDKP